MLQNFLHIWAKHTYELRFKPYTLKSIWNIITIASCLDKFAENCKHMVNENILGFPKKEKKNQSLTLKDTPPGLPTRLRSWMCYNQDDP